MTEPIRQTTDSTLERRWEALRAKLLANFDRLAERGSLASSTSASGRRVWAVRFADVQDGRPVHRNIYVGGDDQAELLKRTRDWLERCRRGPAEIVRLARIGAAIGGIASRLHPRLAPARKQTTPEPMS